MEWLNYHHLLYFWVVAREGSVARAATRLGLAQPTISGQIHALERETGQKLFARSGRNLVLTETGQMVFRYAEEIFTLGRELGDMLKGHAAANIARVQVGAADVIAKQVVFRLLQPVMRARAGTRLVVREGKSDRLVADLAIHALDAVITDAPLAPTIKVRAHCHPLGESPLVVYGTPKLHARLARNFPASLDGAPFLVPSEGTQTRRTLDQWFADRDWRPSIVGEFDDAGVLEAFGRAGEGLFAAPALVDEEMREGQRVKALGTLEGAVERYYLVTLERTLRDPALMAIHDARFGERGD